MKKTLILILTLLVLTLTACSDDVEYTVEYEYEDEDGDFNDEDIEEESSAPQNAHDETAIEYNVLLYDDDYVGITLTSIQSDNIFFSITNNADEVNNIYCEFVTLDDKTYHYEDTNYSTPDLEFAPGETREYVFCDWEMGNETDFLIENTDCNTISARFGYYTDSSDGVVTFIDTGTVNLK